MEVPAMRLFYTARDGMVELDDDVLSIVSQVRELTNGRVKVLHEPTTEHFVLVEHCTDGTERLIFTTPELDGRTITRLLDADSHTRSYEDPYQKAESDHDRALQESDERALDGIRDAGERLAWCMEEDGRGTHAQILVTKDLRAHS